LLLSVGGVVLGDVVSGWVGVPGVVEFGFWLWGGACVSGLVPGVVLPGVVVVPGFEEAPPGVGEAVPGLGAAVPGFGEAVPEFGVVLPGFAVVPGACPLRDAEPVPDCPALDPAAEPVEPADPAEPPDWATNQQLKSKTTDIIEIFFFMSVEASKKGSNPTKSRSAWSLRGRIGRWESGRVLRFWRTMGYKTIGQPLEKTQGCDPNKEFGIWQTPIGTKHPTVPCWRENVAVQLWSFCL
jgi:hypothetical protein